MRTQAEAKATVYSVGEHVDVHSFGRWYQGVVERLGRTRTYVHYQTGSGAVRTKAFKPLWIKPAFTEEYDPYRALQASCPHTSGQTGTVYSNSVWCKTCGANLGAEVKITEVSEAGDTNNPRRLT